jgi:hypothetical protein
LPVKLDIGKFSSIWIPIFKDWEKYKHINFAIGNGSDNLTPGDTGKNFRKRHGIIGQLFKYSAAH